MLDENGAKIVAVSNDQVVIYWQGVEAGRFETSMAAIRYMNAELLPNCLECGGSGFVEKWTGLGENQREQESCPSCAP